MAPQWFKDLYNAYRSRNINQEIINKVRKMVQTEHSLSTREAYDLIRQALSLIASKSYSPRPANPFSFYTFSQASECYEFLLTKLNSACR